MNFVKTGLVKSTVCLGSYLTPVRNFYVYCPVCLKPAIRDLHITLFTAVYGYHVSYFFAWN